MCAGHVDSQRGNREGTCSLVKESWYTSNYNEESDDWPLKKKRYI